MAILSETCVRCGSKKTRQEYDGLPTCEDCMTQMQADRETHRSCPVDGNSMNKRIIKNVIIDQCPKCAGVWLDAGELELLKKEMEDDDDDNDFWKGLILGWFWD